MIKPRPMPPKPVKQPKRPRKRMRQRSAKKSKEHALYICALRFLISLDPLCRRCRKRHATEGHHPYGQFGWLILLFFPFCRVCHDEVENNKTTARAEGWIRYPLIIPPMASNDQQLSTGADLPDMTKAEAQSADKEIKDCVGKSAAFAGAAARAAAPFIQRKGYKALGYDSFDSYVSKEIPEISRRRIFQILSEESIKHELDTSMKNPPALSGRALGALKDVPEGQRAEALKDAQKEHGTKTPTGQQVEQTVKRKWRKSRASEPKKDKKKPAAKKPEAKDDPALVRALDKIQDAAGKPFRRAIEDESVTLTRKEILTLASQKPDKIAETEKLITVNRWKVDRALAFLNKQPTEKDRIAVLFGHALAAANGIWEGTFGAFHVTVKAIKSKLNR